MGGNAFLQILVENMGRLNFGGERAAYQLARTIMHFLRIIDYFITL